MIRNVILMIVLIYILGCCSVDRCCVGDSMLISCLELVIWFGVL